MGLREIQNLKANAGFEKEKPIRWLARVSKKMAAKIKQRRMTEDEKFDAWFEEQRRRATGFCAICGKKSEKYSDEFYRRSAAHLFAKRKNMFPSIRFHPDNGLELCFFGNSCHKNFDDHMISLENIREKYSAAWESIVEKAKILYPCMTEAEKNRVPQILLTAIFDEQNSPTPSN